MRALRIWLSAMLCGALVLSVTPAFGATLFESVAADSSGWRVAGGHEGTGAVDRVGVLASSANGTSWTLSPEVPYEHFVSASLGNGGAWAVSSYTDAAWKTAASPLTMPWSRVDLTGAPTSMALWDVAATGPSSAVAVGERLDQDFGQLACAWRTLDGGSTWVETLAEPKYAPGSDGGIPQSEASFAAADSSGDFIVAAGAEYTDSTDGFVKKPLVYFSSDNAGTWTPWSFTSTMTATWRPADVDVPDSSTAWIAGSLSRVAMTSNGGSTWKAMQLPTISGVAIQINGIAATDDQHAVVVGDLGKVARTSNGGTTWTTATLPTSSDLRSVAMRSASEILAVGEANAVFLSSDGGATWAPVTIGTAAPQPAACSVNVAAPATIPYAGSATITASLRNGSGGYIAGKQLTLQRSSGASWIDVQTLPSASASIKFTVKPTSKTTYRVRYLGDGSWAAANSTSITVAPCVYLSTPTMSSVSGRTLTISGYLKPKHAAGTKLTIYSYRLVSGKWVRDKNFYAKAAYYSTYNKYSLRFALPRAGTWHFKTGAAADSAHAVTYSAYTKSLAVK